MSFPVSSPIPLTAAMFALLASPLTAQDSPLVVEVESGPAWQSYNDVEVPNDGSATRFSLHDLAGSGPWPAGRLHITWNPWERHGFRLLVAPFALTEVGTPEEEVLFTDVPFQEGVETAASYTFNSYRLSYRYTLLDRRPWRAWVGFTAKVRHAEIELVQPGARGAKDDLGFVPLLHLAGAWRLSSRWRMRLESDALAGGPGRAVDAALQVGYDLSDRWTFRAGYRMVEGGADVPEVYAFAWLHYASLSVAWHR